jgi:hypothetical protein
MMTVMSAPGDLVVATSDGIGVRFAGVELTTHLPAHLGGYVKLYGEEPLPKGAVAPKRTRGRSRYVNTECCRPASSRCRKQGRLHHERGEYISARIGS